MDIGNLLAALKASGVRSFEGYGVKLTMHPPATNWRLEMPQVPPSEVPTFAGPFPQVPPQEQQQVPIDQVDPGLAQSVDGEMSYEKILNWSASPEESAPTPLAGEEQALTSE